MGDERKEQVMRLEDAGFTKVEASETSIERLSYLQLRAMVCAQDMRVSAEQILKEEFCLYFLHFSPRGTAQKRIHNGRYRPLLPPSSGGDPALSLEELEELDHSCESSLRLFSASTNDHMPGRMGRPMPTLKLVRRECDQLVEIGWMSKEGEEYRLCPSQAASFDAQLSALTPTQLERMESGLLVKVDGSEDSQIADESKGPYCVFKHDENGKTTSVSCYEVIG